MNKEEQEGLVGIFFVFGTAFAAMLAMLVYFNGASAGLAMVIFLVAWLVIGMFTHALSNREPEEIDAGYY